MADDILEPSPRDAAVSGVTCRVWLCDLTYTQQTISSDVMPAAVGCIATYAQKKLGDRIEVRLFKFPEKLARALADSPPPHVIGFSNYIWNRDLSSEFARVIKAKADMPA